VHLSDGREGLINMEARLICSSSKSGESLNQISELSGLSIDEIKETLGQITGLTPEFVGIIFDMKQRGLSLEQISQENDVELETLRQFLTDSQETPPTTIEETKLPQHPILQHTPNFFYSCQQDTNILHRVNLLTGEQSKYKLPHYKFKGYCRWSELPGGSLLITGGAVSYTSVRDVVKIDTLREYAASFQPPMHTGRSSHAAVYHSQYVYVLGGYGGRDLSECERYVCAESRWEVLPVLPEAAGAMSAVELQNSLYALGGTVDEEIYIETVQKLSLDSLTWQLMQLKLPTIGHYIPCFKKDSEVYLVLFKTLYSFTPLEVKPIKTIPEYIQCTSSY
jgi:lambda repressor-like predicted transcriptional regulator